MGEKSGGVDDRTVTDEEEGARGREGEDEGDG